MIHQSKTIRPQIIELVAVVLLALMGLLMIISNVYPKDFPCREIPIIVEETE